MRCARGLADSELPAALSLLLGEGAQIIHSVSPSADSQFSPSACISAARRAFSFNSPLLGATLSIDAIPPSAPRALWMVTRQLLGRLLGIFSGRAAPGQSWAAIAGVAAGSSMCVEEGDRQFRALDVGVVTEAGERDRWGTKPG
jgi:hypothetical protein